PCSIMARLPPNGQVDRSTRSAGASRGPFLLPRARSATDARPTDNRTTARPSGRRGAHEPSAREGGPIMSPQLGFIESYTAFHIAELHREVNNDRLADLATGLGRPWRSHVADWLLWMAERLDDSSVRVVHAEA